MLNLWVEKDFKSRSPLLKIVTGNSSCFDVFDWFPAEWSVLSKGDGRFNWSHIKFVQLGCRYEGHLGSHFGKQAVCWCFTLSSTLKGPTQQVCLATINAEMDAIVHRLCHLPCTAISLDWLEQNQCCSGTDDQHLWSCQLAFLREGSGMVYNGYLEDLLKARGQWVLTQLAGERRLRWWRQRNLGKTASSVWVKTSRWRAERGSDLNFKLGKTFDSQNMILVPENAITIIYVLNR